MPQRPGSDPAVEALLEYLATTAVTPPADLTARIHARIAREPDRTPPRRYALALLHLRLGTAAGAFRQLIGVAGGRGTFPALIRMQALGLVLVTVLAAAALAAGAAVGVTRLVQEQRTTHPTPPTQTILPGPTAKPTPRRSEGLRSPAPSPSDTLHLLAPDPTPSRTPHPSRTPRPQDVGGADATPHPATTPKAGHPEPTRTPHPTPRKTPKPARTPRPTERPERTRRPEPTETPEAEGGGGNGGSGPGQSEAPDDHGGEGSVWSGDLWLAVLVPPSVAGPAEGHA